VGNILRVLGRDALRLLRAPAAMVVVIALLVLPSVYTWYNVVAFWNPYENTGNLRVCVVNQDAGAATDLTGEMNVGDRIVEELKGNTQLQWVENDYDAAMGELKSGELYAVYVIPENFSECLVSPLSGEVKTPELQYYVNEKLGPVSPKITDTGATTLDQTINSVFVKTVTDVAVAAVDEALENAASDIDAGQSQAVSRLNDTAASLGEVRDSLGEIGKATEDARAKAQAARTALDDAEAQIDSASAVLQDVSTQANAVQSGLASLSSATVPTLASVLSSVSQASSQASTAANDISAAVSTAQADVSLAIGRAQAVADSTNALADRLRTVASSLEDDDPAKSSLNQTADDMAAHAGALQQQIDATSELNSSAGATAQAASDAASSVDAAAQQSISSAQTYSDTLLNATVPAINDSLVQLGTTAADLSTAVSNQRLVIEQAKLSVDQLQAVLEDSQGAVSQTDGLMSGLQEDLGSVATDVQALRGSDAVADLIGNGTLNARAISEFMGSPTELETLQLYAPNAYGSAMAPLFMNLTCWIGAFMLMVILKKESDAEHVSGLTLNQRYIGRFALFAVFVALQAAICVTGVVALGVQVANLPALYLATIAASLAYLSIIFALSLSLRHIGMGLCIVLVFAQIPGASGLYPVEMTSPFFQAIYPLFPFSYGIDAMREAICGFYGDHFVHDLVLLGCFFVVFMMLGMASYHAMSNVIRMVAGQLRESDLFNGGDVVTPARPYRISQVVRALSDRADYHHELVRRYERFSSVYPKLIRASIVLGVGVPAALVLVFALTATEKVVLLTLCLLWLVALSIFLVVVESLRYSFERQLRMGTMTDEHLLDFYSARQDLVPASTHVTSEATPGERSFLFRKHGSTAGIAMGERVAATESEAQGERRAGAGAGSSLEASSAHGGNDAGAPGEAAADVAAGPREDAANLDAAGEGADHA
jgi:putative membrane protein